MLGKDKYQRKSPALSDITGVAESKYRKYPCPASSSTSASHNDTWFKATKLAQDKYFYVNIKNWQAMYVLHWQLTFKLYILFNDIIIKLMCCYKHCYWKENFKWNSFLQLLGSRIICKVYIWYILGSSDEPQQRNEGEKKMNQTYRQDSQDSKVWIENYWFC